MKAAKDTSEFLDDWLVSRIDHSTQDPNVGLVETLYQTCSAALIYLWKSQLRLESPTLHKRDLQKDVASIRLWEENFPSGHLDTILGESSDLKINVLENLTGIGKILLPYFMNYEETKRGRRSDKEHKVTLTQELETQLEKARIMLNTEEKSDLSSEDETSDDSSSAAERRENRLGRLHCYISCLLDLAPMIEKNVSCLYRQVEAQPVPTETMFQLSHEAQPYAMRIRDRFLDAPTHLVERLAEANWERSIRIRAQKEEKEGLMAVRDAQTFFKPYSLFHDSGIGSSIPTASHYAATVASHTSFLSIAGEVAPGRPRVPPLLQEYSRLFGCEYCGKTVSMRNRIEWKMHVFADLQSYLCTHEDCRDALKTFPTRKLWVDHEFNEHFTLRQWRCFTCRATTSTQQSFVDHLTKDHNIVLAGHRLTAAIAEAQETDLTPEFINHKCALCSQGGWKTKKSYATHVGQHLEEISLACLPRYEGDSSDDSLDTDTSSDATRNDVLRNDQSEDREIDTGYGIRSESISITSYRRSIIAADETERQLERLQELSPFVGPPPVEPPEDTDIYRRISVEPNIGGPSNSFPVPWMSVPWKSPISDYQSAIDDQVDESVSAVMQDTHIDKIAILNEPVTTSSTSKRPTSYWSADEKKIFPQLLAQIGLNFEGLANSMERKTPQMVQNYYERLAKGRYFEGIIADAKARKALGTLSLSDPIYHQGGGKNTSDESTHYPRAADPEQTSTFEKNFDQNYQHAWTQPREISPPNTSQLRAFGLEYHDPTPHHIHSSQHPAHKFKQYDPKPQTHGKESPVLQQDSLLLSFEGGGTESQAHHQHAAIQLVDALAANSRHYERQPSMKSIDAWASDVYHTNKFDQPTSNSSMMDYNRQLAQSTYPVFRARRSSAPIEQDYTNLSEPQEGELTVIEWSEIYDISKRVPVEPQLERAGGTLRNPEEALFDSNSGQQ